MQERRNFKVMTENKRKSRKKGKDGWMIAMTILFIALILGSTGLLFLSETEEKPRKSGITPTQTPKIEEPVKKVDVIAVVLEKDTELKMITVYNVVTEEEQKLVYTGATTFFDGYGVQLSAGQLQKGSLYQFTIDTKEECIQSLFK